MYSASDIRSVHLEVTTKCNASCPQCPRNYESGLINEQLPLAELSESDVRYILPPTFVRQLRSVSLCGNYGDPAVARDTVPIATYLRDANPRVRISVHTNGSARSAEWWRNLARVTSYCRFGIDGLEDTNPLYRRGTAWQNIMRNLSAFIEAGGVAEWAYIAFEHNEHQIDAARALSRQLGVSRFFVKRTNRFRRGSDGVAVPLQVTRRNGAPVHTLAPPRNPLLRHPSVSGPSSEPDDTAVVCQAEATKSVFVSAEGLVFPCCYVAHVYQKGRPLAEHEVVRLLRIHERDLESLNAKHRTIEAVLTDVFFERALEDAWSSEGQGRLNVCDRVCGQGRRDFSLEATVLPDYL